MDAKTGNCLRKVFKYLLTCALEESVIRTSSKTISTNRADKNHHTNKRKWKSIDHILRTVIKQISPENPYNGIHRPQKSSIELIRVIIVNRCIVRCISISSSNW